MYLRKRQQMLVVYWLGNTVLCLHLQYDNTTEELVDHLQQEYRMYPQSQHQRSCRNILNQTALVKQNKIKHSKTYSNQPINIQDTYDIQDTSRLFQNHSQKNAGKEKENGKRKIRRKKLQISNQPKRLPNHTTASDMQPC